MSVQATPHGLLLQHSIITMQIAAIHAGAAGSIALIIVPLHGSWSTKGLPSQIYDNINQLQCQSVNND